MGGSVSGEHGVGVGKIAHICEEHGEDHMNIQRAVKRALDPTNIMNPGKVGKRYRWRREEKRNTTLRAACSVICVVRSGYVRCVLTTKVLLSFSQRFLFSQERSGDRAMSLRFTTRRSMGRKGRTHTGDSRDGTWDGRDVHT